MIRPLIPVTMTEGKAPAMGLRSPSGMPTQTNGSPSPEEAEGLRICSVRKQYKTMAADAPMPPVILFTSSPICLAIGFGDVDECSGTTIHHNFLFAAMVDTNHAHSHPFSTNLNAQVSKSSTCACNYHPLSALSFGFAEGRINSHSSTEIGVT